MQSGAMWTRSEKKRKQSGDPFHTSNQNSFLSCLVRTSDFSIHTETQIRATAELELGAKMCIYLEMFTLYRQCTLLLLLSSLLLLVLLSCYHFCSEEVGVAST